PILDRLELGRSNGALFALGARFLERCGTQEAAHMIGAEWRFRPLHLTDSFNYWSKTTPADGSSTTKLCARGSALGLGGAAPPSGEGTAAPAVPSGGPRRL